MIHNFIISLYSEDDEKQNKSICEILYEHIIFVSLQCILQESKYDASYYILNIRDHHADLLENEISEVILILKGWYFNGTRQDKRLKLLRNGISFCHIIDCIAMNEKISWSWENEKEWCSIWKIESSTLQGKIRD